MDWETFGFVIAFCFVDAWSHSLQFS